MAIERAEPGPLGKRQEAQTEIQEIPLQRKKVLFSLEQVAWRGCGVSVLGDILKSRLDTRCEASCAS